MSRFICSPPGRPVGGFLPVLPGLAVAFGCLATTFFGTSVTADAAAVDAPPAPVSAPAVGPYDPAVTYPAGSLAIGADGNTYRASKEVKGVDPTQAKADAWHLAHVSKEVILDVPARFPSIGEAMAFLDGCRIAESAKVVVLVAPGKLEHDAPLVLNHAEGARIVIRGAGEKPEDCVLVFDGSDGLVANEGGQIRVANLSLMSQAEDKGTGLVLEHGSRGRASDCRITGFARSVFVTGGSRIQARQCIFVAEGRQDGVTIANGSTGLFVACIAKATGKDDPRNGFTAFNGGTLECQACRSENWYGGFNASNGSSAQLADSIARNNNHGAIAWAGSCMQAQDCTFAANREAGISAMYSTAEIMGCTLTGNGIGVATNGPALANFLGKTTKISGGRMGLFSHFGGRFRSGTEPVFQNVAREIAVGGEPGNLNAEEAVLRVR